MKHEAPQFELPLGSENLEAVLRGQFALNAENDARNWTDESMAMVWVLGRSDWDWWHSFPEYQRTEWVHWYQDAQLRRTGPAACHMQTFEQYHRGVVERFKSDQELAESWAKQIQEAWLKQKPCPISVTPQFEHILAWAFRIAQLTPKHLNNETQSTTV